MEQMQVRILSVRPVSCQRNSMGSGWSVQLSTSGRRPNRKDSQIEQMPSTVGGIVSMLRIGLYLGEA